MANLKDPATITVFWIYEYIEGFPCEMAGFVPVFLMAKETVAKAKGKDVGIVTMLFRNLVLIVRRFIQ